MNNELDIDRIYLYTKDPKKKISIFYYHREGTGLKHFNDPKAFIEFK